MAALLRLRIGLCAIALFIHETAETIFINFEAFFTSHLESEIKWETVGVVKFEDFFSWKNVLLRRLQLS